MARTLSSNTPLKRAAGGDRTAGTAAGAHRARAVLVPAAAALLLAGVCAAAWWWRGHAGGPAPSSALALRPVEARLLGASARVPGDPGPYVQLAEEYAGSGQPASALWACNEAATRAPSDASVRLKLAALLARLGYAPTAEGVLRSLLPAGGAPASQARLDLANLFLTTGRPKEALALLKAAGAVDLARGRAYEALGENAAAAAAYRRAAAAGDADGYERLARLMLAAGNLEAAQKAMRAMVSLRSARPEDLLLVAAIRAAAGTPHERGIALERLRRLIELRPGNAEAHHQAALLLLRQGDRLAALVQLTRATQLDPGHAEARRHLADLLQTMGQSAKAHRERAGYYELTEQPDRAIAELRAIPANGSPEDLERTLAMVRLLGDTQQTADAVKEAQAGLRRHPNDPELTLRLGLLYETGEWSAPLAQLCRDWIAREPASGFPHWLLGREAVRTTRADEGIRQLELACAEAPNRSDFCASLAFAYLMVPTPENYAKARPWLEKAVALNPNTPGPHEHLGRVLEHAGDLQAARRQYLLSLDRQPDQTAVLTNLAQIASRQARPQAAKLYAELARIEEERARQRRRLMQRVREQPEAAAPRLALARFLIQIGQLEVAKHHLERAASGPATSPAREALAEVDRLLQVQSG